MYVYTYEEHITGVMGHNLLCQKLLPVIVVSQDSELSEKQIREMERSIYTSDELGPVNGKKQNTNIQSSKFKVTFQFTQTEISSK